MDHCPECGFSYDLAKAGETALAVISGARSISAMLTSDIDVRSRRTPGVWSPLEYGCHVRDVLLVQRERVLAARRVGRFECTPMGRDERVDHDEVQHHAMDIRRQLPT